MPDITVACAGRTNPNKPVYLSSQPLDIDNPKTYQVVNAIYQELGAIFDDPMVVFGADEVRPDCWNSKGVKTTLGGFTKRVYADTFRDVKGGVSPHVAVVPAMDGYGQERDLEAELKEKQLVFWERVPDTSIPRDKGIVLMWQGEDQLTKAAKQGYSAVRCHNYYLDYRCEAQRQLLRSHGGRVHSGLGADAGAFVVL
jgi:N-acetyl-beta-hexosaminidase